jgi:hypothetical protein
MVFPEVEASIAAAIQDFDQIPPHRAASLENIARYVTAELDAGKPAKLTFICTHNSRRSLMSQIWAQTAAHFLGLSGVETYSGGTEATAFNSRAVSALERSGFRIEAGSDAPNPVYRVWFAAEEEPLTAFSKVYDHAPNPTRGFCAVMTCSKADMACPLVRGAESRIAIPYEDPKAFDGTDRESEAYDLRCRQIASEMLYLFFRVSS